jgi:hypothetical protein
MIFSITSNYNFDTNNICLYYNIDGTNTYITPNPREAGFVVPNNIDKATSITVPIGVNGNKTANTYNLGIMLRPASIQDSDYVPYAPTNKQLVSWEANGILGAKNILKNNIASITRNGVTYTPNSDGTFIANGTATANGGIEINANINGSLIEGVRYKVSLDGVGADKDGTQNGIMMYVAKYLNGTNMGDVARSNKTSGFTDEFVYHKDSSFDSLHVGCYTFNGASFTNSTLKPMIRLASDSDNTYQPYAKTNRELTDEFKSYGITTIWTGSKTKGDTGMNFDASPYDLCFAQVGGTWCRLITGVGGGSTTRKKFSALYAGRDYVNASTYEQYYLLDIVPDGTIATCGWFDIASKDTQNAKLAGQKALELALAGTSTWTNPTWKTLADVETNVNVSKIIGIKFQPKS